MELLSNITLHNYSASRFSDSTIPAITIAWFCLRFGFVCLSLLNDLDWSSLSFMRPFESRLMYLLSPFGAISSLFPEPFVFFLFAVFAIKNV